VQGVRGRWEFEGEFVLAESQRETASILPNFVSARTIIRHHHHQRVSAKQRVHELPAPLLLYTYLITFTPYIHSTNSPRTQRKTYKNGLYLSTDFFFFASALAERRRLRGAARTAALAVLLPADQCSRVLQEVLLQAF
jgi:hypothetical protein